LVFEKGNLKAVVSPDITDGKGKLIGKSQIPDWAQGHRVTAAGKEIGRGGKSSAFSHTAPSQSTSNVSSSRQSTDNKTKWPRIEMIECDTGKLGTNDFSTIKSFADRAGTKIRNSTETNDMGQKYKFNVNSQSKVEIKG